ncbi:MAG: hypothetical protein CM1200mP13_17080 [Candidatus Pelagibacterales bacterium]|nr:MAG: hypothetical protein CM1200mP13_17080 [Pelagibacterales bacterium]
MTNKIPHDEQGEFQGGMTSLVSLTANFWTITHDQSILYFF